MDRSRADTHGGQAEPERGTESTTGGAGGAWDRVSQGESRRGCAGAILVHGIGGTVERGQIVPQTVRATQSAPGQAQHPQRVTARQQRQTGRREAQRAADGAFRARYRYIIPKDYMNVQHAIP